jgi:pimeloyl-ACP methyl ester carboxylesterase
MHGARNERGIWLARGGSGSELLVLLHGIGANATVWQPMVAEIEKRGTQRWMAPDFRGHGRSAMEGPYGFAAHAGDVAHAIRDEAPATVTIIGHSFGGVVAALVGSGLYGPMPRQVATVGVKLDWSPAEIAKSQEIAARPARVFGTREEAIERYLKGAGLFGLIAPDSDPARVGVLEVPGGFCVALDPRVFSAVGPTIARIFGLTACPVRLAAGSNDPMVTHAAMQRLDPSARLLEGLGHNAHWETPAAVLDFAAGG